MSTPDISSLNNLTFDSLHASVPLYATPNDGLTIIGNTYTVYPNSLGNIAWADNNNGTPGAPGGSDVVAVTTTVQAPAANAPYGVLEYHYTQENPAATGTVFSPSVGGIGAEIVAWNPWAVLVHTLIGYFPGQTTVQIGSDSQYFIFSVTSVPISEYFLTPPSQNELTFTTTGPFPTFPTGPTGPVIGITGTAANQQVADPGTISPFAHVAITDSGSNQTETVTVTPSATGNGAFSQLGTGTLSAGVYTVTGTAAQVSAALDGLVFTPTALPVTGQTATTSFTIAVSDTGGGTANDSTTSVTATQSAPPAVISIAGTSGGQPVADPGTIGPFANVTISDTGISQHETVTVTPSAIGNGSFQNLGSGTVAAGVYTVTGTPAVVSAALDGLVFAPTALPVPGQTATTSFTIAVRDDEGSTASDSTTSVVATESAPPAITGTVAVQQVADPGTIAPFAQVAITDTGANPVETVTIAAPAAASGAFTNLGTATLAGGQYTFIGTPAAVSAQLDAVVFTPAALPMPGQTSTTAFTIGAVNNAGLAAISSTVTVIATESAPPAIAGTVAGQQVADPGTISPFAHVTITDSVIDQPETVTVTPSSVTGGSFGNLGSGTLSAGVYTVTGTDTQVTAALDGLTFTPAPLPSAGQTATTTFSIAVVDAAGLSANDGTTSVTATETANVAPSVVTISGTAPGQAVADPGTISPFAHVTIADSRTGEIETVTVTPSPTGNGVLSHLGAGSLSGGTYTVIGNAAAVSAALDALVFTPNPLPVAGQSATTGFTIAIHDSTGSSASDNATSVTATQTAPTIAISGVATAPLPVADPGTIVPFAHVAIADNGIGQTETVTVTPSAVGNGVFSVLGAGTLSNGVYTVTGSAASVSAALDQLVFTPTILPIGGQSAATSFTIAVTDSLLSTASDSSTSVIATQTPPTIAITGTAAGQHVAVPGTIAPFAHVAIADNGIGQTETVTVTPSATGNGALSGLGTGTLSNGVYTVIGSAAAVSAALDALVFTPVTLPVSGQTATTSFTIAVADSANSTRSDTTTSVIATQSTLPVVTISGTRAGQTTANVTPISPFSGVVIADTGSAETESVTVSQGSSISGTLGNVGTGSYRASTGVYSVTGTAAAVTAALDALVFTPVANLAPPGQSATTTFTIAVADGDGSSASDSGTTVVTVESPAPALTIAGTAGGQTTADSAAITPFGAVTISDNRTGQTETVTVTLSAAANGTLTNTGTGSYDSTAGVYTVTGMTAAVTAALNALKFVPAVHQVGAGQTVRTVFTIAASSSDGATATNSATSVATTAAAVAGFAVQDASTGQSAPATVQAYTGSAQGPQSQYVNITPDSLNVSVSTPNWFIHTGGGDDAIAVSGGTNVLDGGGGSNFLDGGAGIDTFFVDDRSPSSAAWSTVNNFLSGDSATIWGITQQGFGLTWMDGEGAVGYTGLTLHAIAAGSPEASLTLVGYSRADLSNGRLSVTFGTSGGSPYMNIHENY